MTTDISPFVLDHIIIKTNSISQSREYYQKQGFNVQPGGRHADGITENNLIVLQDRVYLELISFVELSSNIEKTQAHWWYSRPEGLIDWALTPSTAETAHKTTTLTTAQASEALYHPSQRGGRKTPSGHELEWSVTFPISVPRGRLPFFCEDLTPRQWRVPKLNENHPNGALSVHKVLLLSQPDNLLNFASTLQKIFNQEFMQSKAEKYYSTSIGNPSQPQKKAIQILVRGPETADERTYCDQFGEGLYSIEVLCKGISTTLHLDSRVTLVPE